MRSTVSNTNKLLWSSPLESLFTRGGSKTLTSLQQANIDKIEDLLWILPLKIHFIPDAHSFNKASIDQYFRGRGKIVSIQSRPNFKARGKGRAMLLNITVIVQDLNSTQTLTLKWFNSYGSVNDKLKKIDTIEFVGVTTEYMGQLQILNPEFQEYQESSESASSNTLKIQYPTINGVNTTNVKRTIDKIPKYLWDSIEETLTPELLAQRDFLTLEDSFKIMHGKVPADNWNNELVDRAKERLIYEEFFLEQIKIKLRKDKNALLPGVEITVNEESFNRALNIFPYQLTEDQKRTVNEVRHDLLGKKPMMRLVQGDVGCGKTSVALISALLCHHENFQSALMCPTESLALQHFQEAQEFLSPLGMKISLLIGSTTEKEKKNIKEKLLTGEIDFIIGTHALFQDSVQFKNLGLSIIDEQHKFGVEQRLKLANKQKGSHCLIMTATPIPRSLSLTQYGDLDISIIKTMPSGRKGCKTRVVTPGTFEKFLSFINTRLQMSEQVYIVVPAINESETQEFLYLEQVLKRFENFFPNYRIKGLHGQLSPDEKSEAFKDFKAHKIDILIATSVIEVGINVTNATVMAIMNPERFGLSSLHQLRGRVGRGDKPGFCFLVNDRQVSPESLQRLQVIEKYTDGFKIAEEDLKIRGSGDLFGTNQSGIQSTKRLADIVLHQNHLLQAREDVDEVLKKDNISEKLGKLIESYRNDERIFSTI